MVVGLVFVLFLIAAILCGVEAILRIAQRAVAWLVPAALCLAFIAMLLWHGK